MLMMNVIGRILSSMPHRQGHFQLNLCREGQLATKGIMDDFNIIPKTIHSRQGSSTLHLRCKMQDATNGGAPISSN